VTQSRSWRRTARRVTTTSKGATRLSNKELKLTKPSIMELRSLTLCSADHLEMRGACLNAEGTDDRGTPGASGSSALVSGCRHSGPSKGTATRVPLDREEDRKHT